MSINVKINSFRLTASPKAVIARYLNFNTTRISHILERVSKLSEEDTKIQYENVLKDFDHRHRDIETVFTDHFMKAASESKHAVGFSTIKKLFTGALFTMEYSIMASALFNPSIVEHPDQSRVKKGSLRFIMSLRATGEGHISSIIFKTGNVDEKGEIELDSEPEFFTALKPVTNEPTSDYTLQSSAEITLNEKVLFPVSPEESIGMEDTRFVKFSGNTNPVYFGTYTAYNGKEIRTKIIETNDFHSFHIRTMHGRSISDKGMALFPEKINGKYAMVSRQGGEFINIMFSEDLLRWEEHSLLMEPEFAWEFVQLGNCGSPVKTEKGWLLLTHGVGPVRTYVISAIMLDLNDPSKIIGRLDQPLIKAKGNDREGYVPNVVYTCGFIIHNGLLVIPYAVSDSATAFATVSLKELFNKMNLK